MSLLCALNYLQASKSAMKNKLSNAQVLSQLLYGLNSRY